MKQELEELLVVGAKVKIGKKCAAESGGLKEGQVIELIEGYFEYDNGLYVSEQKCPAIWDKKTKDFESIYHLFGNDLERFLDSEIVNP